MHAVLINEQSLDLIATNNGGVVPEIKYGASGYPITYFVLPTNPNDPAEILDIREFFNHYKFTGDEALDAFRPVEEVVGFVKREPYSIKRDVLAQMVAAHTSGISDAIAEQQDFDFADKMLALLEAELTGENGPCPRCGGDHSWCQNVSPNEFGPG